MLKRLYDKSPLWFALAWIITYCVLLSVADAVSMMLGTAKVLSFPVGLLLSLLLLFFLKKHGLLVTYGLCRSQTSARDVLYYLPLLLLLTANLWYGVHVHLGTVETVLYILTMLCVGFLEEVIFRGLLFFALCKDNKRTAVIVSSVTFGFGHIINLINGSGAELLPNLMQVIYATAAGFMFVMLFCKTRSLVACIVTHGVFNALSVFSLGTRTALQTVLSCVLLTLITGTYAVYLAYSIHKEKSRSQ